jgi:hypothetical protein
MTTPGKIIEYIEHGKFLCAAVLADAARLSSISLPAGIQ